MAGWDWRPGWPAPSVVVRPPSGSARSGPACANRPGTAGWYRCLAFERAAAEAGLVSATLTGDGFADTVKQATADLVAERLGQLDLLVYSVAAPRRHDPRTGQVHSSAIKAIGEPVTGLDYDLAADAVLTRTMPAADEREIADTVKVMGGEDFAWWVAALRERGLLATGVRCVALSYVGVPRLAATYRGGTLGRAKQDLEDRTRAVDAELRAAGLGSAEVAVLRALVTQASTAIPLNTLYTMLLLQVLAEFSVTEDVLDQGVRLVAGRPGGLAGRRGPPPAGRAGATTRRAGRGLAALAAGGRRRGRRAGAGRGALPAAGAPAVRLRRRRGGLRGRGGPGRAVRSAGAGVLADGADLARGVEAAGALRGGPRPFRRRAGAARRPRLRRASARSGTPPSAAGRR